MFELLMFHDGRSFQDKFSTFIHFNIAIISHQIAFSPSTFFARNKTYSYWISIIQHCKFIFQFIHIIKANGTELM